MENRSSECNDTINISEIQRIIRCSICLETYNIPISLPCFHSFCRECIIKSLHEKKKCPICSKLIQVDVIDNIHPSAHLQSIITLFDEMITKINNYNSSKQQHSTLVNSTSGNFNLNNTISANHVGNRKQDKYQRQAVIQDAFPNESDTNNIPVTIETTNNNSINNDPTDQLVKYKQGDLVEVMPRTWIGINKAGGAAWIVSSSEDYFFYTVKYVLNKAIEQKVYTDFIKPYQELDRNSRKSRNNTCKGVVVKEDPEINDTINSTDQIKSIRSSSSYSPALDCSAIKKRPPMIQSKEHKKYSRNQKSSSQASLESLDQNKRGDNSIVILTTSMDSFFTPKIESFINKFSNVVTSNHRFDHSVTHLVVSLEKDGLLKQRTMKYMQSLMAGLWIVSTDWIVDSIKNGAIVPEDRYEVIRNAKAKVDYAPKRARLARQLQLTKSETDRSSTGIFFGISILLFGQYPTPGPPRSDLEYLLLKGYATLKRTINELHFHVHNSDSTRESMSSSTTDIQVVVCTGAEFAKEYNDLFSLELTKNRNYINLTNPAIIVNPLWILDSVTCYERQSF
eukprot:gene9450-12734_t